MQLQYLVTSRLARRFVTTMFVLTLAACSDRNSPEGQVRAVLDQIETAAEARDIGDVTQHLSENYRDSQGMSAQETSRYLRGFFLANQTIHLLSHVEQIEFPTPGESRVRVLVGMAGRDATAAKVTDLSNLTTDLYVFDLALREEDGEWKLTFAEWRRK